MPFQPSLPLCEGEFHTKGHVPAALTACVIAGSPGITATPLSRVPSLVAPSPGLMIHRSCAEPAVAAGKFQRSVSPTVAVKALGSQWSGNALTSSVFAAPPPPPACAG